LRHDCGWGNLGLGELPSGWIWAWGTARLLRLLGQREVEIDAMKEVFRKKWQAPRGSESE